MKNTLDFLYKTSKDGISFTGIMEAISHEVTIVTAIHNIKSNAGSKTSGIDKIKMDKYLQMPKNELISLIKSNFRNYKPKPAKRVYIDKLDGGKRPLGIPTIMDRILQECIRIIIEPICEAKFYPHSYGFRPYRSQKHAVMDIIHKLNVPAKPENKAVFALEGDIKGCFDNINHRILLKKLWKIGVHDKRVIKIINLMLKAGYIDNDIYNYTKTGTMQGGIISPLLCNVYLNDFDWYVGRMYCEPHRQCTVKGNDIRRLREQGRRRSYNVRYADDWIIQTSEEIEAKRLKIRLTKYFKHRLKLELSDTKTRITDMRTEGAKFLGFVIKAEKARLSKNGNTVGKAYIDMRKLSKKITNLCTEIHKLKKITRDNLKAAQIQYINSVIMGITEYTKFGICTYAHRRIDNAVNYSCYYTWKYMFPDNYMDYFVKLENLNNLPHRHKDYTTKTFAIKCEDMWIGITKAFITHSEYTKYPLSEKVTPYTAEGRKIRKRYIAKHKTNPLDRPSVNSRVELAICVYDKTIYNFEYFMNREYAINRDKWKCRCCGKYLDYDKHCHHVDLNLPLNKINKVPNLAWVCTRCHQIIHSSQEITDNLEAKTIKKIQNFRNKLNIITQ